MQVNILIRDQRRECRQHVQQKEALKILHRDVLNCLFKSGLLNEVHQDLQHPNDVNNQLNFV